MGSWTAAELGVERIALDLRREITHQVRLAQKQQRERGINIARVAAAPAEVWHLRFRDPNGQWYTRRATTNQLLHGLREGFWPVGTEVARGGTRQFRPIATYAEFRKYLTGPQSAEVSPLERDPGLSLRRQWQVLLSTGFGVGLLAAASLATVLRLLL